MSTTLEFVKALAPIATPAAFLIAILLFRKELKSILKRLPNALDRLNGAEGFGLKLQLENLKDKVGLAESEPLALGISSEPIPPSLAPSERLNMGPDRVSSDLSEENPADSQVTESLGPATDMPNREYSSKPHIALGAVMSDIRKEMRVILATMGLLASYTDAEHALYTLEANKIVSANLRQAVNSFFLLSQTLLTEVAEETLTRETLELGYSLLDRLKKAPRSLHEVICTNVPLYSDPDAEMVIHGSLGVMLRGRDEFGRPSSLTQIFPTTRRMTVGTFVSWEWNMERTYTDTWYKDPITFAISRAWSGSAEFVGRNLADI